MKRASGTLFSNANGFLGVTSMLDGLIPVAAVALVAFAVLAVVVIVGGGEPGLRPEEPRFKWAPRKRWLLAIVVAGLIVALVLFFAKFAPLRLDLPGR
jgi:hypothetical protein